VQRLLKENGTGFVVGVGQSGSVQGVKTEALGVADEDDEDFSDSTEGEDLVEAKHRPGPRPAVARKLETCFRMQWLQPTLPNRRAGNFPGLPLPPAGSAKKAGVASKRR
jgi:hypothetical protein